MAKLSVKGWILFSIPLLIAMFLGNWVAGLSATTIQDKMVGFALSFAVTSGLAYYLWERYLRAKAD